MAERVLILDDDAAIGRTIALMAQSLGMEHRIVANVDAFFEQLNRWLPTHIVLDLVMPEMDGVEIIAKLAERGCKANLVISSGVESRIRDAALRAARERDLRVSGILAKPFCKESFKKALASANLVPRAVADQGSSQKELVSEGALKEGIARKQLQLVYQPKVDCVSRTIVGFETLVRWKRDSGDVMTPDHFIPLAESTGLIDSLTEFVIEQGVRWLQATRKQTSMSNLSLSINLSTKTLDNSRFVDFLEDALLSAGLDTPALTLELTETAAMADPVLALDMMTRLRIKGFQLSLDDFGTGYSSLVQLARMPFSEIKVDKSFVMAAPTSSESRIIIRSIIDLAHNLGLKAVAEGVEDQETLEYLAGVKCDLAQGFYIARPMHGDEAIEWVAAANRRAMK